MSYYDDLGVSPSASTAEIRESYRTLVRLLHPDAQTEPQLKQAAELQMKRLNHIHTVLTDPDRRRRYDTECAEGNERLAPIIIQTPPAQPRRNPGFGTLAWVGAALGCGILIAWLATRDSSSAAVAYVESIPKAVVDDISGGNGGRSEKGVDVKALEDLRSQLRLATLERDAAREELARLRNAAITKDQPGRTHEDSAPVVPSRRIAELPVRAPLRASEPSHVTNAALIAPAPPVIEPEVKTTQPLSALNSASQQNLAGVWIFPRKKLTNKDKALYPPEYIETTIVEENGNLHGKYKARYMVSDRAISPDVTFEFAGKPSASPAQFAWTGAGGSKGEVKLKLISDKSMEVVWVTTHLGKVLGLASGTAVLVRRPDNP